MNPVTRIDGRPYIAPPTLKLINGGYAQERIDADAWLAEREQPVEPTFGEKLVDWGRQSGLVIGWSIYGLLVAILCIAAFNLGRSL